MFYALPNGALVKATKENLVKVSFKRSLYLSVSWQNISEIYLTKFLKNVKTSFSKTTSTNGIVNNLCSPYYIERKTHNEINFLKFLCIVIFVTKENLVKVTKENLVKVSFKLLFQIYCLASFNLFFSWIFKFQNFEIYHRFQVKNRCTFILPYSLIILLVIYVHGTCLILCIEKTTHINLVTKIFMYSCRKKSDICKLYTLPWKKACIFLEKHETLTLIICTPMTMDWFLLDQYQKLWIS